MLLFLLGCVGSEPAFVSVRDLDKALASGDTPALCAGLRMKDDETRREAAEKLKDYGFDSACLCERLKRDGRWDPPVLSGLSGSKDAEKTGCAGTLLDDAAGPERVALVTALLKLPTARARLATAAATEADPAVRAAAMAVYRGTKDPAEIALLTEMLAKDADPSVRAGAAGALLGQATAASALRSAVGSDPAANVRGAALETYHSLHPADFDAVVCAALMADPEPAVRIAALSTLRATRDPEQLACLRQRATTAEPAPEARAALLRALGSSSAKEAADILCDAIPGWVKAYVKDAPPAEEDDILKAQNDRDFERSYDCVQAAVRQSGGYTCAGRVYVTGYFRGLGGKSAMPGCAGGGQRPASNEIVF